MCIYFDEFDFFPYGDYPFVRPHDAWKTTKMIKLHHFLHFYLFQFGYSIFSCCVYFFSVFISFFYFFFSSFPECFLFSSIFVVWKPSTEIIIRRLIDKFYVRFYFCLFSSVCRLFSCFDASMPDLLPFGISNLYLYFANLNEIWCMWVLAVAVVFFFLSLFTSIKTRIELKGFL